MSGDARNHEPVSHLHPVVGAAIGGLILWLVLSVWGFAADGYADYLLAVVSGFFLIAAGIPYVLWRVWRRHQPQQDCGPLGEWLSGEFDTGTGQIQGKHAAAEILLPIAAVSFGMTIFGIVLYLTEHGVV